jgi:hypothetical protein
VIAGAGALLLVLVQTELGFPVELAVGRAIVKDVPTGKVLENAMAATMAIDRRFTGWYWAAVGALAVSLILSIAEWWLAPKRLRAL